MEGATGNVECLEERMEEEVPSILSPEFHDVLPIFASMLDIKSFMRLAMTSKDMYKRCMEDKSIRINVDETELQTFNKYGSPIFRLDTSLKIRKPHIESYIATLRKLPCQVNLRTVDFKENGMPDFSMVGVVHNYLKELRVKNIKELIFWEDFTEWSEEIISFVKDFKISGIHFMNIESPVPLPILRSLLQMDVQELSYEYDDEFLPVDFLLESTSAIPKISFTAIRSISMDKFMKLVSKVREGSLRRVEVHFEAVDWKDYEKLPFDHEGLLPESRPLLIAETSSYVKEEFQYWFLHSQGDVTKCVTNDEDLTLQIFKCEEWELPYILRKDEDVLKDLAEKRPRVLCSASQFKTFTSGVEMLPPSHEGSLPRERPLYCSVDENFFWMLDEDDKLMSCKREEGCATWDSLNTFVSHGIGHSALAKYTFWKLLKEEMRADLHIYCEYLSEFDSWFEDCERFDFDYLGPLPTTRPLVFERTSSEERSLRIVLFEEYVVQCKFAHKEVHNTYCTPWNLPAFLITADIIKEILQKTLEKRRHQNVDLSVYDYEKFHAGFEGFKTSPCDSYHPEGRPFVYEKKTMNSAGGMIDERWFSYDGAIRKATWKEGRFLLSIGDFREFPSEFMKQLFREFSKAKCHTDLLFLELEQLQNCLEQFTVISFEYSGPLTSDSPMAFVKNEIRHTCRNGATRKPRCKCIDFFLRFWFLWDGMNVTYGFWGDLEMDEDPLRVWFRSTHKCSQMPPALTTIERLRSLIQGKFDENVYYDWFGSHEDLLACLNEFTKLPFDYDGPLPVEHPLLFETVTDDEEVPSYFLLRADGSVIKCKWNDTGRKAFATLSFPSKGDRLPVPLRFLPSLVFCRGGLRCCRSV